MIRTVMVSGAIGILTMSSSAYADEGDGTSRFGSPGFIVSADRLIPLVTYESVKTTQSDGSSETKSDLSFGLLSNAPYTAFGTFYNLPRLGFDWLPVRSLTLGGALFGYVQALSKDNVSPAGGPSTSGNLPKVTYWGFAPRVGYIIQLGRMLAFWPRAGVEYHNVTSSAVTGSVSPSVWQLSVEAEAMFVIFPWNHFGFTVGPTVDVPLAGKSTSASMTGTGTTGAATPVSYTSAMFQTGVSAGMLGHF